MKRLSPRRARWSLLALADAKVMLRDVTAAKNSLATMDALLEEHGIRVMVAPDDPRHRNDHGPPERRG